MLSNFIFILLLLSSSWLFYKQVAKIRRNILLGKPENRSDQKWERFKIMLAVAFGQTKMQARPIAAFFHFIIYVGFILINIEVLEILIDGIFGTHRIFQAPLGSLYSIAINFFEILALGVLISCIVFLTRRNIIKLKRFSGTEMVGWPVKDANYILVIEIILMAALLIMNASEALVTGNYYIISSYIAPIFNQFTIEQLHLIERTAWWFHIVGIFAFLNYLPKSKHFHVILAFPNTWYSDLNPVGKINNMAVVTNEVKAMLDPSYIPQTTTESITFGAKDVTDLSWKSLMDAYSCTECGRCTSSCPANITGKLLSPRKIMMDTRDRLEEVGKNIDAFGLNHNDNKSLINDYISTEELFACTTCNACVEACPININPLKIIVELRRYAIMEQSNMPNEWANMTTNIENNGAPWQFAAADRQNWINE